jgi:hypothetical protein
MAKDGYVRSVKADAGGKFELTLYGDFGYGVTAAVYGERPGESGKVKVPGRDDRPRLGLTVKPK